MVWRRMSRTWPTQELPSGRQAAHYVKRSVFPRAMTVHSALLNNVPWNLVQSQPHPGEYQPAGPDCLPSCRGPAQVLRGVSCRVLHPWCPPFCSLLHSAVLGPRGAGPQDSAGNRDTYRQGEKKSRLLGFLSTVCVAMVASSWR